MIQQIATRFTRLFNMTNPIVVAPMGYAVTPSLAAAVTSSGGLGTLGAAYMSSAAVVGILQETRKLLKVPEAEPIPLAMGFLGWILDKTEISEDPRLPPTLEQRPKAIWLAFGDDLGKYVDYIRAYDAKREHKTLIIINAVSVEEAVRAAKVYKADAIVVQGHESGGHGGKESPPLSVFLPAVIQALPADHPPLLVAGGIATGAQIAAFLTLGAEGAVLGTRFLTTHECSYTPLVKSILQTAGVNSTIRTTYHDDVARTTGWPSNIDGAAIVNKIVDDHNEGVELAEIQRRYDECKASGERKDRLVVWAGMSVALSSDQRPAAEVVAELNRDALRSLTAVSALVQSNL